MKIAIYSDNFYPELGGIQDSVEALAKELVKRGHKIIFFAPKYSRKNYSQSNFENKELDFGPSVQFVRYPSIHFPSPTGQSRIIILSPFRWLKVRKEKPDIIHTQTFYGVGLEALVAAKILKIPIVGTNHMALKAFAKYFPFDIQKFVRYVLWYYNHCDFITAPSQSVFDDVGEQYFKKPHRPLSNPIDTINYHPIAGGKRDLSVICAGRLGEEKNVDVVIRSIAEVKHTFANVKLVIAGRGSIEKKLKRLVTDLDIDQNVFFVGTLNKTDLAAAFQRSSVFVTMSTSETQSMVLLQAMACGTPVIGANSLALPEYINKDNGFLITPGDHVALAEKITYLLNNPEEQKRMGSNAHAYVQQFSVPNIATEWENIYHQVIDSKK